MQGLKASTLRPQCPLWVISGHLQCKKACLLCANSGHRLSDRIFGRAEVGLTGLPTHPNLERIPRALRLSFLDVRQLTRDLQCR